MFTAADDAALGVPIETGTYPSGEEGIQKSLVTICKKIREGAPTAVMKSFAGNLMKQNGFPTATRDQGRVALEHVRKNVLYAPDALGTEQIQSAKVTLCVEGAPICIPCGDCDDLVTALGTILAALGHEVRVTRQIFGAGHQQHVLVEVRTEDGLWFPLDPSSKTMPAGTKAPAEQETYHSPWDEHTDAKFVGIGKLIEPLQVWIEHPEQWSRVGVGQSIEEAIGLDGIYCMHKNEEAMSDLVWQPIGKNVEALRRRPGTGALNDVIAAAFKFNPDPLGVVQQVWGQIQGRSWNAAINAANARAGAKNWLRADIQSKNDLITLLMSSAINAKKSGDKGDSGTADLLNNTWLVLANRMGLDPASATLPQIQQQMTMQGDVLLPVVAILGLFISTAFIAALYALLIYYAAQLIDNFLARVECDRELVRIHSQVDQIAARHNADGLPWTDDEKALRDELAKEQQFVASGCTVAAGLPTPPGLKPAGGFWDSPWAWFGVAAFVSGGVLAVVYRDEIKTWIATKQRHSAGEEGWRRRQKAKLRRRRRHYR